MALSSNFYRFSFCSLIFSCNLFANPSVEQVAKGTVRIEQNGPEMTIHAPHKSIIDYHSFDIGREEKVTFLQPSAQSCVLNRIHSATPSQIEGTLTSNGILYLVNPAGICFGKNSVVDVGGILAAAAHIAEEDFLLGKDRFSQASGEIVHRGKLISDSFVRFLGQKVLTQGEIIAKEDTSLFVSQDHILFGPSDGHTFLVLQKEQTTSTSLGSGDLFSLAIQHEGTIRASQVTLQADENGKVNLLGKVDVSNAQEQRGGNVALLGAEVSLKGATIDAHGDLGGGEVYIGGSEHGKGPLPNASNVLVDQTTSIFAQATQNGNGGKVIMYSDGDTRFEGAIDVGAGAKGGDGGFIEVSGKQNVFHNTDHINGLASYGKPGLFFIDPNATLVIDDAYVLNPINTTLQSGFNFSVAATDLNVTTNFLNLGGFIIPSFFTVTLTGTNSITFNNDGFSTRKENLIFRTDGTLNFPASFGNITGVHIEFHGHDMNYTPTFLNVFPYVNGQGDAVILFDVTNPVTVANIFCDEGSAEQEGGTMQFSHDLNVPTIRIFPDQYTITIGGVFNGGLDLSDMEFGSFNLHLLGGGTVTTANLHNVGNLSLYGGVPNLVLPQNFTTDAATVHTSGIINFGGTTNLAFSSMVVDGNTTFNNFGGFQSHAISASNPAYTLTVNGGNSQPGTFLGTVAIGGLTLNSLTAATFSNNLILQNDLAITGPLTNVSVAGQTNAVNATINNTGGPAASVSLLGGGSITGTLSLTNVDPLTLHATSGTPFTFGNGLPSVPITHLQGPFIFTNAAPIALQTLILDGDTTMQGSGGNVSVTNTITPATASLSIGTNGHSMGTTTFGGTITLNDFSVFASTATFAQDVTVHNYTSDATGTAHGSFIVNGVVQMASFDADGVGKNVEFLNGGTISGTATFTNTGTLDFFGTSTPLTFGHGFNASAVPTTKTAGTISFLDNSAISMNNLFLSANTAFEGSGGTFTVLGTLTNPPVIPINDLILGTSSHPMGAITFTGSVFTSRISITSPSTATFAGSASMRGLSSTAPILAHNHFFVNDPVLLAQFTADGSGKDITFQQGGTINGTTSFANDLASITFGGNSLDSLFLLEPLNLGSFTGTLTIAGTLQTADKPIDLGSALHGFTIPTSASITSLFSADGANIVFHSTIDGPGSLDVDAGSHLVQFFGSVGEITPLSLLESTALSNEIHTPLIHTGGGTLVFNGNTQLFMPTTFLDDGSTGIFFNGTLNGSFDLTLATFGAIAFLQDVGTTNPLGNVSIDFALPVVFVNSVTAEGSFFCQSFTQHSGRGDSSFVSMNTSITPGAAGGDINILTEGTISFTGAITTKGGTSIGGVGFDGGDITLTSTEASVAVADIDTSGSDAVAGAGGNAGNVILQPSTDFDSSSLLPEGKISLSGNITCLHGVGTPNGTDGDISLDPAGRDIPLAVATIYSKDTDGNITLTGKDLIIGTNDSLTTLGSFTGTFSGTAQVGDIVTGNNLNLHASTIVVYKHLPSLILTSSDQLTTNPRVHFIAGGLVSHSHEILQTGPGDTLETTSFQFSSAAREAFVDNLLLNNVVLNFFSNHTDNSLLFSSEPVQMANLLRVDWDLLGETLIDNLWIEVFDELGQISSSWARSWRSLLKDKRALEYDLLSSTSFSPKEFATRLATSEDKAPFRYASKLLDLMMRIEFSPYFSSPIRKEEKRKLQNQILQVTRPEKISLSDWKDLLQEISLLKHTPSESNIL